MRWDYLMRTIMIVDDEPGVQEQIKMAMWDEDARIICAQDSRSALAMLDDAGIAVQDPCKTEPLATGMDVVTAQEQFNRWIKGGRYDLFADKFLNIESNFF